tara:strand:+ start:271 stop:681 length:411 start_codon:yes stop_codon:yes gene_type:complete
MFAIGQRAQVVEVAETYMIKLRQQQNGDRYMKDTDGLVHAGNYGSVTYFETEAQAEKYQDLLAEKQILKTAFANALERIEADCSSLKSEQPVYEDRVYRSNMKRFQQAGQRFAPEVETLTLIVGPVDELGKKKTLM